MSIDYSVFKLGEEYGEFIQAFLIHKKLCRPEKILDESASKKELERELSDVVGSAILVAKQLDIDLEKAIQDKWFDYK